MMNNDTIRAGGGFDAQVESIRLPLADSVRRSLEDLIIAESHSVARAHVRSAEAGLAGAEEAESTAQEHFSRHAEALTRAHEAFASMPRGSWAIGSGLLISFAAFVTAEWLMNAEVLPWLFSVSPESLTGALLSLAPAAVPIVLDQVLGEVFSISGARAGMHQRSARWLRTLGLWVGRAIPFVAVGCLILTALWMLAETRPVLVAIKEGTEMLAPTSSQQGIIDRAMQWLAIAVAVAGGFCYLLGIDYVRCAQARRKAAKHLTALENQASDLRGSLAQAREQRRVRLAESNDVDRRAQEAAALWEAERRTVVARLAAHPGSLRQQVESVLWDAAGVRAGQAQINSGSQQLM